jgi:hypothetical protein
LLFGDCCECCECLEEEDEEDVEDVEDDGEDNLGGVGDLYDFLIGNFFCCFCCFGGDDGFCGDFAADVCFCPGIFLGLPRLPTISLSHFHVILLRTVPSLHFLTHLCV